MKIKNIINWIIIIIISTALIITTFTTNSSKEKNKEITNILQYSITKNEIKTITQKIKNKYPQAEKLINIDALLKKYIIEHIYLNINIKKTGIICTSNEILYTITNANFFKVKNAFSIDSYKKYLQNQKLIESFFQNKLKYKSENTQIAHYIKHPHNHIFKLIKNKKQYNKNTYLINKIAYTVITKKDLIKNLNIKNTQYFNFEKNIIKTYKKPTLYKIKYYITKNNQNIKNIQFITSLISNTDINKNILRIAHKNINKNKHSLIKNKTLTYLIKINKIKENNLDKNTCKKDIINKYKNNIIKKILKNKNTLKELKNIPILKKKLIISQRSKKSVIAAEINRATANNETTILINEKLIFILTQYKKHIKAKQKLKTPIYFYKQFKIFEKNANKNILRDTINKTQTYH